MHRPKMTTLNDCFSNWLTYGIFSYLQSHDVPWKTENIQHDLDLMYHGSRSGEKPIAPLVKKLLNNDGELVDTMKNKIASMIYSKYNLQWQNIWEVLHAEYDPISNYDMVEDSEDTNTGTVTDAGTRGGTDTVSKTGDDTVNSKVDSKITTQNGTQTNKISAFNSSGLVNASSTEKANDVVSQDAANNKTEDKTTYNSTDTTTYNSTMGNTRTDNLKTTHHLTRKGNIGVTTSQQMQQSSLELWQYNFFDVVMRDIDREITLVIY